MTRSMKSVLDRLLGGEPPVTQGVVEDAVVRLSGRLGDPLQDSVSDRSEVVALEFDVGGSADPARPCRYERTGTGG